MMSQHTPKETIAGAISCMTSKRKVSLPNQVMILMESLHVYTLADTYIGHAEAIKG